MEPSIRLQQSPHITECLHRACQVLNGNDNVCRIKTFLREWYYRARVEIVNDASCELRVLLKFNAIQAESHNGACVVIW